MSNAKDHVKYKISRQNDGTYAILKKSINGKNVDIHSTHDTYDEAKDELTDIHHKPNQVETMIFLNDLKDSIKNI